MTTTAHEDQFTAEPEPVRQPYDTGSILRRNVADLELALKQQTERAEKAEAELAKLREQKPAGYVLGDWRGATTISAVKSSHFNTPLYAEPSPVPAPAAPAVPEGDNFNGDTPHMIRCIEALVDMSDRGKLTPHALCGHARKLLLASANRLRQQVASSVPDTWREAMQEAHNTFQRYADLHQAKGTQDGYEKAKANQKLANKLYVLLSAPVQIVQPGGCAPAVGVIDLTPDVPAQEFRTSTKDSGV